MSLDNNGNANARKRFDVIAILQYLAIAVGVVVCIMALARVINLSHYIDTLKGQVEAERTTLAHTQSLLARTQSKIGIIKTSITDNQSEIGYLISQIEIFCPQLSQSGAPRRMTEQQATAYFNRSQLRDMRCYATDWRPTSNFLEFYNQALTARIDEQNKDALRLFDAALGVNDIGRVDPQWRARAFEGKAYALMNLGNYDEAKRANDEALHLFPKFVFAGITRIKLMCHTNAAAAQVRDALADLRHQMSAVAADASAGLQHAQKQEQMMFYKTALHFAQLDMSFIEQDGELFASCSYALDHAPT